jgi:hypothetical protein
MFESTKYERCNFLKPHERHRWYPHWYSKTRVCLGMEEDPWLRANPSLGHRVTLKTFDERDHHKHRYQVRNRVLITPQGMSVVPSNVYFQCIDPKCWHIYFMPREALQKEMLKKPVYQTWPG